MMIRRKFIHKSLLAAAGLLLLPKAMFANPADAFVMTVSGPVHAADLGFTLSHEHILADFIGAKGYSRERYNADEVFNRALPFLLEAKKNGCVTFTDCSPAYIGRDVKILKRLADATGLNIITNTGYYGAVKEKFLLPQAYTESASQIADRWIAEFKNGIERTDIKPGLIKTSVDGAPLTPTQRKIIEAAAITHLATGLTIAIHTDSGEAAKEELAILKSKGVSPSARIWVHAQKEKDTKYHLEAARIKSWVSLDNVTTESVDEYIDFLKTLKAEKLLDHVLVSHDSGWYNVGEPNGGNYKDYNCIFTTFIPALKKNGFTQEEIDLLFITNPAKALAVQVRKI